MTREEIQTALLDVLTGVAPEVDAATLVASKPLRKQVDLDSADWLNVLVGIHERLGVEISDADAARLSTLDMLVDHCVNALQGRAPA